MREDDLWVVVEHRDGELLDISKELCSQGRRMKGPSSCPVAILVGKEGGGLSQKLAQYGVKKAYSVEGEFNADAYVDFLSNLVLEKSPSIILFGSTSFGNALASRLAIRSQAGLVTDCLDLRKYRGSWAALKPMHGGKVNVKVFPRSESLQLFTLKPGAFEIEEVSSMEPVEMVQIPFENHPKESKTEKIGFIQSDPKNARLEDAELIVAGGKGFGDQRRFKLLEELADLLGATMAGSRAAVDMNWISYERQIGLTGKKVAPRLLVTVGISGVFEFAAGIKDSKFIVAINNDPCAPIFKAADLGMIGDLNEILPMLNKRLENEKS